jgi:preprotein translocase subunit SecG
MEQTRAIEHFWVDKNPSGDLLTNRDQGFQVAGFMSLLLGIFTFLLVLIALFMMLVILMQRAKTDGGVGAALGGGMAESTFGAETNKVLFNATRNAAIGFFVLSFALYLGHLWVRNHTVDEAVGLPDAAPALSPVDTDTDEPLSSIKFPLSGDDAGAGAETATTDTASAETTPVAGEETP